MEEESFFARFPKLRIVFIVVAALSAAGLIAVLVYWSVFSATIALTVAPYDAHIYLNGGEVTNKETIRIRPGDYSIKIERDGFDSEERQVEIKQNEDTRLMFALLPSDGNYQWYMDHPEDSLILDSVVSGEATEEEESFSERFPVLDALPYRTNYYELTLYALPGSSNPRITFQLSIFEVPRDGIFATQEKFAEYSAESRTWLAAHGLADGDYEIISGNEFVEE